MSKETTANKLPYPEKSDIPSGPTQIKALAEKLESAIGIRGRVSSAGAVSSGTGFTAEKLSTGKYKIVLTTEMSAIPAVAVTARAAERFAIVPDTASPKKNIEVWTYNAAGELSDAAFGFHASTPSGE